MLGWCGVHLPGPSDSNQIQHTLALTQTLELQSIGMVISSVATQPGSALELQTKVPKITRSFTIMDHREESYLGRLLD